MISNLGWIIILFILFILHVLLEAREDNKTYKNRDCYDKSDYKCLKCSEYGCKYHIIAERNNKD